jgi:3-deoxy-D-manno-octulosonic-acid transferase
MSRIQQCLFCCYLLLMHLLSPLWYFILNRRLHRGKETLQSIAQKCSAVLPPRPQAPIIWGHAVGVGEVLALAGLFATLAERLPTHHFLITSSTNTSGQVLNKGQIPPRCTHQFAPLDTPKAIKLFLTHWQPILAIVCELDLWPGLIYLTHRSHIPIYLINARLSHSALQRKKRFKYCYQTILSCFDTIYCQNNDTYAGFITLGVSSTHLQVNGSVKALARPLTVDTTEFAQLNIRLNQRPCWLIASSHEGEEKIALAAHTLICQKIPDALLLIAPRYPKRGDALAHEYHLNTVQRSKGYVFSDNDAVYLCDTIGELGLWYSLSQIALIGGSIAKVGGHNPYEALLLNCTVLQGTHTDNFKEVYEDLIQRGLAQTVYDANDISDAVITVFSLPKQHTSDKNLNTVLNKVFEPMLNELVISANSGLGY